LHQWKGDLLHRWAERKWGSETNQGKIIGVGGGVPVGMHDHLANRGQAITRETILVRDADVRLNLSGANTAHAVRGSEKPGIGDDGSAALRCAVDTQ
jgi:hypothetical protein